MTATHAIFKGKGSRKAPAAVVGVEIDYEHFRNTFMNFSNKKVGGIILHHCISHNMIEMFSQNNMIPFQQV